MEDEIDDCNVDVPIKYLHQLQNIYFTLTGTELNVEKDMMREYKKPRELGFLFIISNRPNQKIGYGSICHFLGS